MMRRDHSFLERIIMCDETWTYHYDPCTKQESAIYRWKGTTSKKKVRQAKLVGKIMLMAFFDHKGMVYQDTIPVTNPKTTVNSTYGCFKKSETKFAIACDCTVNENERSVQFQQFLQQ